MKFVITQENIMPSCDIKDPKLMIAINSIKLKKYIFLRYGFYA